MCEGDLLCRGFSIAKGFAIERVVRPKSMSLMHTCACACVKSCVVVRALVSKLCACVHTRVFIMYACDMRYPCHH